MTTRVFSGALLISVLAVLGGCAGVPTSQVSPASTSGPSSTQSDSIKPVAAALTIDAEKLTVTSTSGASLASYNYFEDPSTVVEGLTQFFGSKPSSTDFKPYEGIGGTNFSWNGFDLLDLDQESDGVYYTSYRVVASAATVGGLTIETLGGVSVGDSLAIADAAYPDSRVPLDSSNGVDSFRYETGRIALAPHPDQNESSFFVTLTALSTDGVNKIYAPSGGGPGM